MIKIFDNEREEIDYIFQDEKGYYTSDILQNSLNLFALKYNEANGGEYIFSPNVTLFGAQRNFYFECTCMNNRLCYKMEKGVISPNYWLQKDSSKKEKLKDILNIYFMCGMAAHNIIKYEVKI